MSNRQYLEDRKRLIHQIEDARDAAKDLRGYFEYSFAHVDSVTRWLDSALSSAEDLPEEAW